MKAIIVTFAEEKCFTVQETTTDALIDFAANLGYEHKGYNDNPRNRAELQNQPTFAKLLGPMWDGDKIRYEDSNAYNILSQ